MKSIKEKAKAYDYAIKRAQAKMEEAKVFDYDDEQTAHTIRLTTTDIFPELKESEDEKIRKGIIRNLEYLADRAEGFVKDELEERIAWLEKQGEQKYIPKYKIGDYVKNTNYEGEPIYEIVYMDKECYICEYRGKEWMGDKAVMHFSFDNPYLRLVQKPVDKVEPKFKVKYAGSEYNVLETKDIAGVIFYGIEDEPNHIDYVKAENCEIISGYGIKENGSPYPTKPAVFSEQNPTWSEEELDSITAAINNLEYLKNNYVYHQMGLEPAITFLKSLIERVQPKQEWSEEDERKIGDIRDAITFDDELEEFYKEELYDFLKSIRPQKQWKPSDEQINALNYVVNLMASSERPTENNLYYNILKSLRQQLKKHYL